MSAEIEVQTESELPLDRPIVFVGLMGCGKSSVGKRLAQSFNIPFVDADNEIEKAAQRTIPEIFEEFGEQAFRDGEKRVIERLLNEDMIRIISTGGGAFMAESTRLAIKEKGLCVWLKSDLDTLFERVSRRSHRPLLQTPNPKGTLEKLMHERYPIYAEAELTVETEAVPIEQTVEKVRLAILTHLKKQRDPHS